MTAASTKARGACAVTGAAGYVGSCIAAALGRAGRTVVPMGRHEGQVAFSLEEGVAPRALAERNVTALVHCAYDFSARGWEGIRAVNVEGTRRLFESAREQGVRDFLFISSTAAFDGCRSLYGRAKLETESIAASFGAFIVRPGLVCGREPGGMVGTLVKLLRRSPVVPLIGSGRTPMHTVHEDDLGALAVRLLGEPDDALRRVPITAANEDPLAFRDMLAAFAAREGRSVVFAPVPWPVVWLGVKTLETLHVGGGGLRSDSVVSFVNANPRPDFTTTRRTGVRFRAFSASPEVTT